MIVKGIPKKDIPPERRKTPHHDNNDGVHGSKASSVNGKSIKKRRSTGLPDENGALEDDDDEDDINAFWPLRFPPVAVLFPLEGLWEAWVKLR